LSPLGWRKTIVVVSADEHTKRLELEIRFNEQPIRGRLHDREGAIGLDRPFSGWLGLMAAIDAAAPASADPPAEPDHRWEAS